jgi:UDP-N-acetylmuramate--alanine ligase
MSGIALVLSERGGHVSGSDIRASRYTDALERAGVRVSIGHDASNVGDVDVVVVSSAIRDTNPELMEARRRGMEIWPRARMLAHLAEDRRVIAVAGTHGKTTTSSMIATMISGMGLDPTFLIGGEVVHYGTNAVSGGGEHYVVEADESDGSFLFLEPEVAVVTNIEADHLDHYGSIERIEETFLEFMGRVRATGTLVVCADDRRLMKLARASNALRVLTYGFAENAEVRIESIDAAAGGQQSIVRLPDGTQITVSIAAPGLHNVSNATAALATAYCLGLDTTAAAEALSLFDGVRRRFDRIGVVDGVTVVDDYAHHPTEVRATLTAASSLGFERVWAVFQPHRFTRTEALAEEFGTAFDEADRVVLFDVYGAGETPIPGVTGHTIVDAVMRARPRTRLAWLPHRSDATPFLLERVRPGDLVLTMGAGDVTTFGPELVRALDSSDEVSEQRS